MSIGLICVTDRTWSLSEQKCYQIFAGNYVLAECSKLTVAAMLLRTALSQNEIFFPFRHRRLVARTDATGERVAESRSNQRAAEKRADSAGLDARQRRREPRCREEGISSRVVWKSCAESKEAAEGRGMPVNYAKMAAIYSRKRTGLRNYSAS